MPALNRSLGLALSSFHSSGPGPSSPRRLDGSSAVLSSPPPQSTVRQILPSTLASPVGVQSPGLSLLKLARTSPFSLARATSGAPPSTSAMSPTELSSASSKTSTSTELPTPTPTSPQSE